MAVITVTGNLQDALNAAKPGDILVLSGSFSGSYIAPTKTVAENIIVTTSDLVAGRSTPSKKSGSILTFDGSPALTVQGSNWIFQGLEIAAMGPLLANDLVRVGLGTEKSTGDLPTNIVIDGCYIHGSSGLGCKRGIALNGTNVSVTRCYISEIKLVGQDSQAICAWNSPGPFVIDNNYLEAAGENIMFGGAEPGIPGLIPTNITISNNTLSKQERWRGISWLVKNLLELKNAQNVTISGNLLEYCWAMGQNGFAVLFTPRYSGGTVAAVSNVNFRNNVIQHCGGGFQIAGYDDSTTIPTILLHNVSITNNLLDVSRSSWGGYGTLFLLEEGADGVSINHNTGYSDGFTAVLSGKPLTRFEFTDNLVTRGDHGFNGSAGEGEGTAAINVYCPDSIIYGNVMQTTSDSVPTYPPGFAFVSRLPGCTPTSVLNS